MSLFSQPRCQAHMLNLAVILSTLSIMVSTYYMLQWPYIEISYETEDIDQIPQSRLQFKLRQSTSDLSPGHITSYESVNGINIRIAVGGAITSAGYTTLTEDKAHILTPFRILFPSFCKTASQGFEYHFYFGYDTKDSVLNTDAMLASLQSAFTTLFTNGSCAEINVFHELHLVPCEYTKKPAWAQNDAMMQAYIDGMDFFYRVNDDTQLITANWTESFISNLASRDPPYVGVVGPKHDYGALDIMTHDFVHRTHVNIFGLYYPRIFETWYGDTWMNYVYGSRCVQLTDVVVKHLETMGQRYSLKKRRKLSEVMEIAQNSSRLITRYVNVQQNLLNETIPLHDLLKVISIFISNMNENETYGALRNAQLLPILLPDWTLRVYYDGSNLENSSIITQSFLNSLRILGAQTIPIVDKVLLQRPLMLRYMVQDDKNVSHYLIRDADWRLSEREVVMINKWLNVHEKPGLYCIRDHPDQGVSPITDGLWGAHCKNILNMLGKTMDSVIRDDVNSTHVSYEQDTLSETFHTTKFLLNLWDKAGDFKFCHDSVTCHIWSHSHPVPEHVGSETSYIGQTYTRFENEGDQDLDMARLRNPLCITSYNSAVT